MSEDRLTFYPGWPYAGVKLSEQLDEVRTNFNSLNPLVQAIYADLQPGGMGFDAHHDISGWSVGKRDFRNKFRTFYDKVLLRWVLQFNSGTEADEVWNDVLSARESDLRVSIHGPGGIEASVGGFYSPISGAGITVTDTQNTYNLVNKIEFSKRDFYITPGDFDIPVINLQPQGGGIDHGSLAGLTDDDHTQYLRVDGTRALTGNQSAGSNKITSLADATADTDAANLRTVKNFAGNFYGVSVAQTNLGGASYKNINTIKFDGNSFYITQEGLQRDEVTVNFRGSAGSGSGGSQFGSGVVRLTFTNQSEWVFPHALGTQSIVWATYDNQDKAVIPNIVDTSNSGTAYFYFLNAISGSAVVIGGPVAGTGIDIREGTKNFPGVGRLSFRTNDFYLTPDSQGNPVVNFRGTAGGGSGITAVVEDTSPQLGGDLDVNGHLITSPSGNVEITADQDVAISASSGEVNIFAGTNINVNSIKITNLGAPTNPNDAARLVDVVSGGANAGFYGITVKLTGTPSKAYKNINVLEFNRNEFYIEQNSPNTDTVVVNSKPLAASAGAGISGITITDGTNTYSTQTTVRVSENDFYLTKGPGGVPKINLKTQEVIRFHILAPSITNYFIEPMAPYGYVVDEVMFTAAAQTCGIGFYIDNSPLLTKNGIAIQPLSSLTANNSLQRISPTGANTVLVNNRVKLSVFSITSGVKDLCGFIKIRKT